MIAKSSSTRIDPRRGFGLIEMAITGALILVAMTVTVQVIGWVALESKAVERRERALLEAGNLLERILATPWDDLTPESMTKFNLSPSTRRFLRNASLDLKLTTLEEAPARKKVAVEIRWLDRSGRPEAPVRLVGWVYRRGKAPR